MGTSRSAEAVKERHGPEQRAGPHHGSQVNLDFAHLDELLTAVHLDQIDAAVHLSAAKATRIGPVVELLLQARAQTLDARTLPASPIVSAIRRVLHSTPPGNGHFNSTAQTHIGFILSAREPLTGDTARWYLFLHKAEQAARDSGLQSRTAAHLIAAMREMEDNIHRHSRRSYDGIVGFRATAEEFEFVVADSGVGALQSLREHPDYADLQDAGRALRLVLTEGESRFGRNVGHGGGFRGLFKGLADLNGQLRFRTEDHALTIDGTHPALEQSQVSQKVPIRGFLAAVVCGHGAVGGEGFPPMQAR